LTTWSISTIQPYRKDVTTYGGDVTLFNPTHNAHQFRFRASDKSGGTPPERRSSDGVRLTLDVIDYLRHRRLAGRKCAVAGLPMGYLKGTGAYIGQYRMTKTI